jgi:hypothetical protein
MFYEKGKKECCERNVFGLSKEYSKQKIPRWLSILNVCKFFGASFVRE